jgi:hypothetical protein
VVVEVAGESVQRPVQVAAVTNLVPRMRVDVVTADVVDRVVE